MNFSKAAELFLLFVESDFKFLRMSDEIFVPLYFKDTQFRELFPLGK